MSSKRLNKSLYEMKKEAKNMSENEELTGFPSIDKPWLKYYSEKAINTTIPKCTIYEYLSFDFMSIYKQWEKSKCMDNPMVLLILGEAK